ncbi:hypothetical protein DFQ27_008211 [Actinomortierella ambigua]|uniref:Copper transport protein n=1 Tax=Actinomortierella ambigua TaxID=1343610 RepID=A0A9P6TY56_9FUNG|nr:hypothetical protein DFQ27_008211 [Actinomortierella ambigua]
MDHSSGGHSSAGFITGLGVPIWTSELTPLSEAQYIGALFGLFLLSVGFRGLIAAQSYLEAFLHLRYHVEPHPLQYRHDHQQKRQRKHQPTPYQTQTLYQQRDMAEKQGGPTVNLQDEHGDVIIAQSTAAQDAHHPHHHHLHNSSPFDEKSPSLTRSMTLTLTPVSSSATPGVPDGATASTTTTTAVASQTTATATVTSSSPSSSLPPFYNAKARKRQRKIADAAMLHTTMEDASLSTPPPPPPHDDDHDDHHDHDHQQHSKPHWFTNMALPTVKPFLWQVEISRALLTTLVVAVGYLLMLVIMTYHSGYIGAILAGVFIGDVFFGRWAKVRPIPPQWSALQAKLEYRAFQRRGDSREEERGVKFDNTAIASRGASQHQATEASYQQQQQQQQQPHPFTTSLSARSSVSSLEYQEILRQTSPHLHHHDEMVC